MLRVGPSQLSPSHSRSCFEPAPSTAQVQELEWLALRGSGVPQPIPKPLQARVGRSENT